METAFSNAWVKYTEKESFKSASDPNTLSLSDPKYLVNRLHNAFAAGWVAREGQDIVTEEMIRAGIEICIVPALELLYKDPHHWSERPCPTCKVITSMSGQRFGCDRYREERRKERDGKSG